MEGYGQFGFAVYRTSDIIRDPSRRLCVTPLWFVVLVGKPSGDLGCRLQSSRQLLSDSSDSSQGIRAIPRNVRTDALTYGRSGGCYGTRDGSGVALRRGSACTQTAVTMQRYS